MAKLAVSIEVPEGSEAFCAIIVRPKRLPLRPKLAQRVIDTTGVAVEPVRPALQLVRGGK